MDHIPNYLPATPELFGIKQENPSHYQGDCITICIPVEYDNKAKFGAYIKTDLSIPAPLWVGTLNNGIVVEKDRISVKIKSSQAAVLFPSGTYYLAVCARWPQDMTSWKVIYTASFTVTPAANSSNPFIEPQVMILGETPPPEIAYVPISYFG